VHQGHQQPLPNGCSAPWRIPFNGQRIPTHWGMDTGRVS
jgi:hypothetical protein